MTEQGVTLSTASTWVIPLVRCGDQNRVAARIATLAALALHLIIYLPDVAEAWVAENLKNARAANLCRMMDSRPS